MSGYIGPAPVPQATQTREAFTATSGQTTFNTGGYTAGFIDVYLNGVKLAAADYTATNGSDVVLAVGAAADDILETVAYSAFTVADQDFTGETTAEDLTVTGAFTSQGIDDNATSTAMTLDTSGNLLVGTTAVPTDDNTALGFGVTSSGEVRASVNGANAAMFKRATSDGDIVEFRKDSTVVGSIGSHSGFVTMGAGDTSLIFDSTANSIEPFNQNDRTSEDAAITLGWSSNRFKDLYLSGGVYLGGTGSANHLDDYEEGTWTPSLVAGTHTYDYRNGRYRKVGGVVTVEFQMSVTSRGSSSTELGINGLPFSAASPSYQCTAIGIGSNYASQGLMPDSVATDVTYVSVESTNAYYRRSEVTNNSYTINNLYSSGVLTGQFTYITDS